MAKPLPSYDESKLRARPSTLAIVRRNETKWGANSLNIEDFVQQHPLQCQAAMMLGESMSMGDVARELDVSRATVYRWLEKYPEMFVVRELHARHYLERFGHRLDDLASQALRKLEHEMELGGTCARWATMAVLRCFDRLPKLHSALHPEPAPPPVSDPPASASDGQPTDRALPAPGED